MRFGLRTQLLLLSCSLLIIPWLGYRYILDIRSFLLNGQEEAQLLITQAIATSIQERPELLSELARSSGQDRPADPDSGIIYAWPTDQHLLADGYAEEWQQHPPPYRYSPSGKPDNLDPLSMQMKLLQREDQLYLLFDVSDRYPVYRHPGHYSLDTSDQLRLTIGQDHFVISVEAPGNIKALASTEDWRHQLPPGDPRSELAARITGGWQEMPGGYRTELQLPLSLLTPPYHFSATVVDIDDGDSRRILAQVSSGSADKVRIISHPPELQRLVRGLRKGGRHILVLDSDGRTRAVSSLSDAGPRLPERFRPAARRSLEGLPAIQRYHEDNEEFIATAQPVLNAEGSPVGAVLVEVTTGDILNQQRLTLIRSAGATTLAFVLIIVGLLFFAYRLTRRIRRLQTETRSCIDDQGRLLASELHSGRESHDELSSLAADMSGLIGRLHHYTRFLERMPRTLRHELSNPLNTISTSVEILREESSPDQQKYLASADRGVKRLTLIIESITEAASLEEALRSEMLTPVSLSQLLEQYADQLQRSNLPQTVELKLPAEEARIAGNDLRIEQLLDKLIDNAVDFTPNDRRISLILTKADDDWLLQVCNQGPAIPEQLQDNLFESLVSLRSGAYKEGQSTDSAGSKQPHLGIGLFVARTIAEHHRGRIQARNTTDGVCFELRVPALRSAADNPESENVVAGDTLNQPQ